MDMSKNFLNKEQNEAVETISGPLLVLAGAGTGKTRVITYRIANMLKNWISPNNILALTFTNKAAREMKERVGELVDTESSRKLFIGTFHAFCISILKRETKNIPDLHPGFTIADDVDQGSIFKEVLAKLGIVKEDLNLHRYRISNAKNDFVTPKNFLANTSYPYNETTLAIYKEYQKVLSMQNMVDFDDILMKVVILLEENAEVLNKYQEIYKYILVDEFQDTNNVQFRLIDLLAGERQNICVVGDDDQSIYGWRGAKIENILDFPQKFKNTKVIKLEQNYRSANNILKAANVFIAGNQKRHEKNLWSSRGDGEKILYSTAESDVDEARFVARQIYKTVIKDSRIKYKDMAVLYRSNHQSRLFEKAFRNDDIPYRLVGSKSFYERKEIRDAAAYLKLCVNYKDDQSFLRIIGVPARGIGAKAIEKLRELQARNKDSLCNVLGEDSFRNSVSSRASASGYQFSSCLKKWSAILKESGNISEKVKSYFSEIGFLNGFQKMYKNIEESEVRRDNVLEFINAIAQYEREYSEEPTLLGFLEAFSLSDDNDKVDEDEQDDNAVTLLTVHASKGLEFPYVFLVGLEQGVFPNYRALEERDIDEERRLFYVAVTRAKDKLILSNAESRYRYGRPEYQDESEFLSEVPAELLEEENTVPVEDKSVSKAFSDFYKQFS
jgi:DNA helicase II / ATP-dependent DNA helicase PcrA